MDINCFKLKGFRFLVKNGFKHKTGVFGRDAEYYVSSLYGMKRNPNGSRRPDLISNYSFDVPLSIEVKSGRNMKGVLVDYQLHYAINSNKDYIELFGRAPPVREDFFMENLLGNEDVAYYYNFVNRNDSVKASDLKRPYSQLMLVWEDQFIVPHDFVFFSFVVSRHMRTGEDMDFIINDLKKVMDGDARCFGSVDYYRRKLNPQSWQGFNAKDVLAIYESDDSLARGEGKKRIDKIREVYPSLDLLERLKLNGPNDTHIYILYKAEDCELFNGRFSGKIEEGIPVLEKIVRERREAIKIVDRDDFLWEDLFPFNGDNGREFEAKQKLKAGEYFSNSEIRLLERLSRWLPECESWMY